MCKQSTRSVFDQIEDDLKTVVTVIRIRDISGRIVFGEIQHQVDFMLVSVRTNTHKVGVIPAVHRQQVIEFYKIVAVDLPCALMAHVDAATPGGGL